MDRNKTTQNVKTNKSRFGISGVLYTLLLFVGFLCFFSAKWYVDTYGRIGFDSILFTLFSDLSGVQSDLIERYLIGAALPCVLSTVAVSFLLFFPWRKKLGVLIQGKKIQLFPLSRLLSGILAAVLSLSLIIHAAFNVQLVEHVINLMQESELYEDRYVDPNSVSITFPEQKRNLIYIFLESMETSYLSKDHGGALDYNLIPELEALAQNNLNFSHNNTVGGLLEVPGASWTIGAMVAQTAGVPLVTPSDVSDWQNGYGKDGVFLPGLTSLSNILADNGYYQSLMVGSNAAFGGRETYYQTHETDKIYDLFTARKDHIVPYGYFVWWGMEDLHLFKYAQQELLEIAEKDQPFAFSMLTVDTHHIGGYTCQLCHSTYEESYENAIACSSRQVAAFVEWLQAQDFYENTTVIITGDHFSMDSGYFTRNVDKNYVRHGYNCFLNLPVEAVRTKNRQFSALDMFPTTLAAMGCSIEGDHLGLGVNLFSSEPTLIERYGYKRFCSELSKSSPFYADHFYTAKEETAE